jgi:magnesium-transporting ATPase (P-type)
MLLPLLVIVAIDMVFAALEDVTRHKADAKANGALARQLDPATGSWKRVHWWQLAVGDAVLIKNREDVPTDVLIIGVHEPNKPVCEGTCYVETKSLDGETNLKARHQLRSLLGCVSGASDVLRLRGTLTTEHPNKSIDRFMGTVRLTAGLEKAQERAAAAAAAANNSEKQGDAVAAAGAAAADEAIVEPIGPDNVLLRGTVLRNTKWVIGVVSVCLNILYTLVFCYASINFEFAVLTGL